MPEEFTVPWPAHPRAFVIWANEIHGDLLDEPVASSYLPWKFESDGASWCVTFFGLCVWDNDVEGQDAAEALKNASDIARNAAAWVHAWHIDPKEV